MPLSLSNVAKAFRNAASNGVPSSFRYRDKIYNNASFNPGQTTLETVPGGVIENPGTGTIMYAVEDLPKRRRRNGVLVGWPEENDEIEVLWHDEWIIYKVKGPTYGHSIATIPCVSPEITS